MVYQLDPLLHLFDAYYDWICTLLRHLLCAYLPFYTTSRVRDECVLRGAHLYLVKGGLDQGVLLCMMHMSTTPLMEGAFKHSWWELIVALIKLDGARLEGHALP